METMDISSDHCSSYVKTLLHPRGSVGTGTRKAPWLAVLVAGLLSGGCQLGGLPTKGRPGTGPDEAPKKDVSTRLDGGVDDASDGSVGDAGSEDADDTIGSRADASDRDPFPDRSRVLAPWRHEFGDDMTDRVDLRDESVRVPKDSLDALSSYDTGDLIYSNSREQPFLRRIDSIDEQGETVVFETSQASLTELFLKRKLDPERGQTRQGLSTSLSPEKGSVAPAKQPISIGAGPVTFTGTAVFKVTPTVKFGLEVDLSQAWFGKTPGAASNGMYIDDRTCRSASDCLGQESCHQGNCAIRDDDWTCNDIVTAVEYARDTPSCRDTWRTWMRSEGARGSRHCPNLDEDTRFLVGEHMPHPSHLQWAKEHCHGALKRLELKVRLEVNDLKIKDPELQVSATSQLDAEFESKSYERVVVVYGVPITIEFEFEASAEATLTSQLTWPFAHPIGLKSLGSQPAMAFETNAYYYAAPQYGYKGDLRGPGDSFGTLHSDVEYTEPNRYAIELANTKAIQGGVDGHVELRAGPEVEIKLFDLVGPTGSFKGYARMSGKSNAGKGACTLGAQLGVEATFGGELEAPICGADCFEEEISYTTNTCNDTDEDKDGFAVCSSENYCFEHCFTDDCDQSSFQSCKENCDPSTHPTCRGSNKLETCKDINGDSCLEPTIRLCSSGKVCRGGACVSRQCTPTDTRCKAGQLEECECTGNGCSYRRVKTCVNGCAGDTCRTNTCGDGTCDPSETPRCRDCACPGQTSNDEWGVVQIKGTPDLWVVEGSYAHYISDVQSYRELGKPTKEKMSQKTFDHCYTEKRSIDGQQPNGTSDRPLLSTPNTPDYYMYENGEVRRFANKNAYTSCSGAGSFDVAFEHANQALLRHLGGKGAPLCDPNRSNVQCSGRSGTKNCTSRCEWSVCSTNCTDECSNKSATTCAGSGRFKTCGDYDGDPCLELSSPKPCPGRQTCKNDSCGCHPTSKRTCKNGDVYEVDSCGNAIGSPVETCRSSNACTREICRSGSCVSRDEPQGTPCASGQGQCDGSGSCNVCTASSCDDDNPCTKDVCRSGTCQNLDKQDGTTCSTPRGQGVCENGTCDVCTASSCDDNNPCTRDVCRNGTCQNLDKQDGLTCGNGEVCQSGVCTSVDCQSGPCCDGNNNYEPSTTVCRSDVDTEHRCRGNVLEVRTLDRTCSGSDASCSGSLESNSWRTKARCGSGEVCNANQGTCETCPSNFCQRNDYGSGTYCDGSDAVTCDTRSNGCYYPRSSDYCTDGCDASSGGCIQCGSNFCEQNGYSSGTYCDGSRSVRCTTDANGCNVVDTGETETCSNGCNSSTGECKTCECSSGPCCDGCNYESRNVVCQEEYYQIQKCRNGSSGNMYVRDVDKMCPGDAETCSGREEKRAWRVDEYCGPNERCSAYHGGCEPCPSETPDFKDNDCDGRVDEDTRIKITEMGMSQGKDRDHCFARGGGSLRQCIFDGPGWAKRVNSQYQYYIYDTSIGSGKFASVKGYQLSKLMACYSSKHTEHRYLPIDSGEYQKIVKGHPDWRCRAIGYVETGQPPGLAPNNVPIYIHYSKYHTDRIYHHDSQRISPKYDPPSKIWYAWQP